MGTAAGIDGRATEEMNDRQRTPVISGLLVARGAPLPPNADCRVAGAPIAVGRRNLNQTPRGRAAVPSGLIPSCRSQLIWAGSRPAAATCE